MSSFHHIHGVRHIDELLGKATTVTVPLEAWRMTGFERDPRPWPVPNAILQKETGSIEVDAPAGAFVVGIRLYDSAPPWDSRCDDDSAPCRVTLLVNGRRVGSFTPTGRDNRHYVYFSVRRFHFRDGDVLRLDVNGEAGRRIEAIAFLPTVPSPAPRTYHIKNPAARYRPEPTGEQSGPAIRFTWTTNWPMTGELRIEGANSTVLPITEAHQNHALDWRDFLPGAFYRWSVVGSSPDGQEITSGPHELHAHAHPTPPGIPGIEEIHLQLVNESDVDISHWPARASIPFSRESLGDTANVELLDANGNPIIAQFTVLSRWPDHSVRWLLVEFMTDVPKAGSVPITLRYGRGLSGGAATRSVPHAPTLRVVHTPEGLLISTGSIRVELDTEDLRLPGKVTSEGNTPWMFPGGHATLRLPDGAEFTTLGRPELVRIESNGPVRASLYIRGHHQHPTRGAMFAYEARIHVYRDSPLLWLEYTFAHDAPDACTTVESIALNFPLQGDLNEVRFPGSGPEDPFGADELPVTLSQMIEHTYDVRTGQRPGVKGARSPGWIELSSPEGTHSVAVRHFWQNYPKAIKVGPRAVSLQLLPPHAPDTHVQEASDALEASRLFFHCDDEGHRIKEGVGRRHFVLFAFDTEANRIPAPYVNTSLRAIVPREQYAASAALGPMCDEPGRWTRAFSEKLPVALERYLELRESKREYGWMNFGDWWGERGLHWGNLEYDLVQGLLQAFVHTGNPDCFLRAEEGALHQMDVDVTRVHDDPSQVGRHYAHVVGHVGGFWSESPLGMGEQWQGRPGELGHCFNRGLVTFYHLTGDPVALATATAMADHLTSPRYLNHYDCTHFERHPAWHAMVTTAAYEASGDLKYLNASRIIMERVLERQSPGGGWPRVLRGGHCICPVPHIGNVGFMIAVLLQSMEEYYRASADPRVPDAVVRATRNIVAGSWEEEAGMFRYSTCPESHLRNDARLSAALAAAYRHSGDLRLLRILSTVCSNILAVMGRLEPKGLGGTLRFLPWALHTLDEHDHQETIGS